MRYAFSLQNRSVSMFQFSNEDLPVRAARGMPAAVLRTRRGQIRMNCGIFVGNLTRDPEMRTTRSGEARTTFTIAIDRPYTGQDGTRTADYPMITCYRKLAENCAKYLQKGSKVAVEYSVRTGSYEQDGKRVYTTDFVAQNVEFLSRSAGSAAGKADGQETQAAAQGYTEVPPDDVFDY